MTRATAILAFLAAFFIAVPAHASGLEDGDMIDMVLVHAQTGQPALVLSVDKPVESEAIEKQLDYKLGTYIGFVRSGDLYAEYPKANKEQRPLIVFVFEFPPTPRVKAMSFAVRDRLAELGFDSQFKVYDTEAKRNVDLTQ
jgi:hypothetical protein